MFGHHYAAALPCTTARSAASTDSPLVNQGSSLLKGAEMLHQKLPTVAVRMRNVFFCKPLRRLRVPSHHSCAYPQAAALLAESNRPVRLHRPCSGCWHGDTGRIANFRVSTGGMVPLSHESIGSSKNTFLLQNKARIVRLWRTNRCHGVMTRVLDLVTK